MANRTNHSDQRILRKRARALVHLRDRCKALGRSFNEDCPLAPGEKLGALDVSVLRKDAAKGLPEDRVRELGRFANGLGLDGLEIAKWFLSTSQLHDPRVRKRLRDTIRKHARALHRKKRANVSALQVPAIDGLRLTVTIGRKRTTHRLSYGDSIQLSLTEPAKVVGLARIRR